MKNTQKFSNFGEGTKQLVASGQRVPFVEIILPRKYDENNYDMISEWKNVDWVQNGSVYFRLNSFIEDPHIIFFGNIVEKTTYDCVGLMLEDIRNRMNAINSVPETENEAISNSEIKYNPTIYNYTEMMEEMNKGERSNWE